MASTIEKADGTRIVLKPLEKFEEEARALELDLCNWLGQNRHRPHAERHAEVANALRGLSLSHDYLLNLAAYAFQRLDLCNQSGEQGEALEEYLGPIADTGVKFTRTQGRKARQPRREPDVDDCIKRLAAREGSAKVLWSDFESWLAEEGRHPQVEGDAVRYELEGGNSHRLAFKTFANLISTARNLPPLP